MRDRREMRGRERRSCMWVRVLTTGFAQIALMWSIEFWEKTRSLQDMKRPHLTPWRRHYSTLGMGPFSVRATIFCPWTIFTNWLQISPLHSQLQLPGQLSYPRISTRWFPGYQSGSGVLHTQMRLLILWQLVMRSYIMRQREMAALLPLAPHQNHLPPASCRGRHRTGILLACNFLSWTAIASISLRVALYSAVPETTALDTSKSVQLVQKVLVLSDPPKGENQCQKKVTTPCCLVVVWYHLIAESTVPSSAGCQLYQGLWGEQFCMSKPRTIGTSWTWFTKSSQWKVVCPERTYFPQLSNSHCHNFCASGEAFGLTSLSKARATERSPNRNSRFFINYY